MSYSQNSQLPEAVRNSLNQADQSKWRDIFNSAYNTCNSNAECASKTAWSHLKKNARHFAGWASAEVIDRQGDIVETQAFQRTMDLFMQLGSSIIDQHSNRKVGQYINYEFKNKTCTDGTEKPGVYMEGIIYTGQRIHDEVWEKIKSGEYSGLSIGADPLKSEQECDVKTCWNAIKNIDLFEISVVEIPANQEALIEEINHIAKSIPIIGDTMTEEPKTIKKAADSGNGDSVVESTISKSDETLTLLKGADSSLIESIVDRAVEKALNKRLKEPHTPRPELKKNELDKSEAEQLLDDSSRTAGMGYKQISTLLDDTQGARPW